jgi:TatD family-associated radical SAM protein
MDMNTQGDVIAYQLHGNCYVNLTNRCTLRCQFCPKFNKQWQVQGYPLRLQQEPDVAKVLKAIGAPEQYKEVVFCGFGEPTLRLDVLLSVAKQLKKQGARIRVNTDGLANLRAGQDVTPRLSGMVDALSISLNAQNALLYNKHCRPAEADAYSSMLDFIRCAGESVSDITLTAIEGLDGVDISACQEIARGLGVGFRRRVLDRVG